MRSLAIPKAGQPRWPPLACGLTLALAFDESGMWLHVVSPAKISASVIDAEKWARVEELIIALPGRIRRAN